MSVTNVVYITYNHVKQNLMITFAGGAIWKYHPVSMETWTMLEESKQLSKDVHKLVRDTNIVGVKQ